MAKKLKPSENHTIQAVALDLDGKTYTLCFTFDALSRAKSELVKVGDYTNLFVALNPGWCDVDKLPALFYAALCTEHPEITPPEARALITMRTYEVIMTAVLEAFDKSKADPKDTPDTDQGNVPA